MTSFSLAFATLAVISSILIMEFTRVLPEPYMDEIFHIPQAQNYCHGNYHFWNDKITTLPGLYFLSQFFLKLFSSIQNVAVADVCSVLELRFTNAIFTMFSFVFIYLIVEKEIKNKIDPKKEKKRNVSFIQIFFINVLLLLIIFCMIFFLGRLYSFLVFGNFFVCINTF